MWSIGHPRAARAHRALPPRSGSEAATWPGSETPDGTGAPCPKFIATVWPPALLVLLTKSKTKSVPGPKVSLILTKNPSDGWSFELLFTTELPERQAPFPPTTPLNLRTDGKILNIPLYALPGTKELPRHFPGGTTSVSSTTPAPQHGRTSAKGPAVWGRANTPMRLVCRPSFTGAATPLPGKGAQALGIGEDLPPPRGP